MQSDGMPTGGIFVLGFHRSGTSLTARVLHLLGVDLGPEGDLLPAHDVDNPAGYWEPRWMNGLNDAVLAVIGADVWHPLWAESGWEGRPELAPLHERAAALLREKFAGAPVWGVKDPRLCLTLPFWRELVPDLRYVVCVRSPADAVASSLRRTDLTLNSRWSWGQLWLEYTCRALVETEGAERILVSYESFFADPEAEVARLAAFVGPSEDTEARARILEEIDGDLRHHRSSPAEVAADSGLPIEARAAFLALQAARATEAGDDPLRRGLERLAREVWTSHRAWVVERGGLQRAAEEAEEARKRSEERVTEYEARDNSRSRLAKWLLCRRGG